MTAVEGSLTAWIRAVMIKWLVQARFYFKHCILTMHSFSCTNTNHDVKDLVNHGIVENTESWSLLKQKKLISWELKLTFLWNKKIF